VFEGDCRVFRGDYSVFRGVEVGPLLVAIQGGPVYSV